MRKQLAGKPRPDEVHISPEFSSLQLLHATVGALQVVPGQAKGRQKGGGFEMPALDIDSTWKVG
jgi:hypothetical protein